MALWGCGALDDDDTDDDDTEDDDDTDDYNTDDDGNDDDNTNDHDNDDGNDELPPVNRSILIPCRRFLVFIRSDSMVFRC